MDDTSSQKSFYIFIKMITSFSLSDNMESYSD